MNVIYLDPSAWVKRYFAEVGSTTVAGIFSCPDPIYGTRFGLVEVSATVSRKGNAEKLSAEVIGSLLAQADQDFALFDQVMINELLLIDAQRFAVQYRLRAGDAIHLASAVALLAIENVSSVTLVSADKELVAAGVEEALRIVDPGSTAG